MIVVSVLKTQALGEYDLEKYLSYPNKYSFIGILCRNFELSMQAGNTIVTRPVIKQINI